MTEALEQRAEELAGLLEICGQEADNLINMVGTQIDRVEQHFEAIGEEIHAFSDASQAVVDQAQAQANNAVDQGAAYLKETHERINAAIPDLSELLDGDGALREAFRSLDEAITAFRDVVEDGREELMNSLGDCSTKLENAEALVEDCLNGNTTELLEAVLGEALERLEETLVDTAEEVVSSLKDTLTDELTNLEGVAESVMDGALDVLDDLKDTLLDKVETSGEEVIENELSKLAQDIIEETLNSVLDDVTITQISSQITAALSAQLPQLAAAKQTVGAVKRLLDIMRSGGL